MAAQLASLPTTKLQPARKPQTSPRRRRPYTYAPPDSGYSAASSADDVALQYASAPAITEATTTVLPAARTAGPIAENTPAPIIEPSPTITASPVPSFRASRDAAGCSPTPAIMSERERGPAGERPLAERHPFGEHGHRTKRDEREAGAQLVMVRVGADDVLSLERPVDRAAEDACNRVGAEHPGDRRPDQRTEAQVEGRVAARGGPGAIRLGVRRRERQIRCEDDERCRSGDRAPRGADRRGGARREVILAGGRE